MQDICPILILSSDMLRPFKNNGSILLMMLVLIGVIAVTLGSAAQFISRQSHEGSNKEQEDKAHRIAESGVQYVMFILSRETTNLEKLIDAGSITQPVNDPSSGAIGEYTLLFADVPGSLPGQRAQVTSQGKDASLGRCQTIEVVIERISAGQSLYRILAWKHFPGTSCTL